MCEGSKNMEWYNFETQEKTVKENLRKYLKENNINCSISGCYDGWHFEINCNPEDVARIDNALDVFHEMA
jgi:hypothetical protein